MVYPEEFRTAVLSAYPLTKPGQFGQESPSPARVRLALENDNEEELGQLLLQGCHQALSPLQVIRDFGTGQSQNVLAKAQELFLRTTVANQWQVLKAQQTPKAP